MYASPSILPQGPSAGQSAIIHMIDAALGIEHNGKQTAREFFADMQVSVRCRALIGSGCS
jgi:hypothetical protein